MTRVHSGGAMDINLADEVVDGLGTELLSVESKTTLFGDNQPGQLIHFCHARPAHVAPT